MFYVVERMVIMKASINNKENDLNKREVLKEKSSMKLYNVFFPVWVLILLPSFWLVSVPFNFIIDSVILLIGLKLFTNAPLKGNYKRSILKVWIFGYVADMIGGGLMIIVTLLSHDFFSLFSKSRFDFVDKVMSNPLSTPGTFIYVTIFVLLVVLLIYKFNYKFCLKSTDLDQEQKKKVSLLLAILTAPYLFYTPTMAFYDTIEKLSVFFH